MAYLALSDVEARVQWLGPFSDLTRPTANQVTTWMAEAEAIVNGALAAGQLPQPYTSASAVLILKDVGLLYVEGHVRRSRGAVDNDDLGKADGDQLLVMFRDEIRSIENNPERWGAKLGGGDAPAAALRIRSWSTANPTEDVEPKFTIKGEHL